MIIICKPHLRNTDQGHERVPNRQNVTLTDFSIHGSSSACLERINRLLLTHLLRKNKANEQRSESGSANFKS